VIGYTLADANRAREGLPIVTNNGREDMVRTTKFNVTSRGARGKLVIKRGYLADAFPPTVEVRLPDDE
jgi:DNA gyrase subunit A